MRDELSRETLGAAFGAMMAEDWEYLKARDESKPFMLDQDLPPGLVSRQEQAFPGHSGASFAMTMHFLKDIAKRGWEGWVVSLCPEVDFHDSAASIQREWRRAISDPQRALCRRRLMREFQDMLTAS